MALSLSESRPSLHSLELAKDSWNFLSNNHLRILLQLLSVVRFNFCSLKLESTLRAACFPFVWNGRSKTVEIKSQILSIPAAFQSFQYVDLPAMVIFLFHRIMNQLEIIFGEL